ncbi:hypothetical protein QNH39_20585 [Neobacillus novalis]|uniref:Uncharacterized protein n=2 Tax=Neobacillus novalis TaxID=220687 RepID=A0AA95MKT0_9BACI|nr:hypothetical protein [Neobacillus novalis]WHY85022.1 hypothetical protein QNH39_20585 [Neobacillus novalis]
MFMLSILLLSACNNASFKDESKASVKTAKAIFKEQEKKPNQKNEKTHFYLPSGYSIKDKTTNNIILQNGADTYILFINPQEDSSSDVVYKATVDQYEKLDTNEKFTNDNKFGFLTIKQLKDNSLNELTIGVGGAKITTQAKTSNLNEDAKVMMEIVNSVETEK